MVFSAWHEWLGINFLYKNLPMSDLKELTKRLVNIKEGDVECQPTNNNGVTIYPRICDAYRAIQQKLQSINYNSTLISFRSKKRLE